jgi:hypothetical protein
MTPQTMQPNASHHWCVCHLVLARRATPCRLGLPRMTLVATLALALAGCAEFNEFRGLRTDIAHLRSDLSAHSETLATLASRVDQLERRESITNRGAGQSPQELTRAVDVLLKKALETESRLNTIEDTRPLVRAPEKSPKPARQPVSEAKAPAAPRGNAQNGSTLPDQTAATSQKKASRGAKDISIGMTPDEVRRALGDPISTEMSESYVFWHYSQVANQKYVIFEKDTGEVSGWWGI